MWCCCGLKKDNVKLLADQVESFVEKLELETNNLRHVEEDNIRFWNMLWHLDDYYYDLDCEIQHLKSEVEVALPQPSFRPEWHH